jgi:peptidoglycan/LPS O-acetylase OafA/YrhL
MGQFHATRGGQGTVTPVSKDRNRRLDIQGLRAIAVGVVVAFHAGLPIPGGFVGVDVFFVISGFVITAMLHREWDSSSRIRMGAFYLRRFKRLSPALATMVILTVLAALVLLPPFGSQQNAAATGLGAMAMVANFVIFATTGGYFDVAADLNPLLHTWSLSVEEQFYLVFPALLLMGWLVARKVRVLRRLPIIIVILFGAASLVAMLLEASGNPVSWLPDWLMGFYGPLGRAWEFAAGAVLALATVHLRRVPTALATVGGVLGLGLLTVSLWLITSDTIFPGPMTLLPVVATLLLILAGCNSANPVSRVLSTRPFTWVGDRSYSWYLWHWPFIVFSALLWPDLPWVLVVAALVSLLPSMASYRWIENPVRLLPTGTPWRVVRVVTLTLVPALGISALTFTAANNALWNPDLQKFQYAVETLAVNAAAGCQTPLETGPRDGMCVWNADATGAPIYLVGDSKAGQYSSAVINAGAELGRPVTISTAGACPYYDGFIYVPRPKPRWSSESCRAFFRSTQKWLTKATPGLVIISNTQDYILSAKVGLSLSRGDYVTDPSQKVPIYAEGFLRTIKALRDAGQQVLLPEPGMLFDWDPQLCTTISVLTKACNTTVTLTDMEAEELPFARVVDNTAAATGSSTIDIRPQLCPNGICIAVPSDGVPITRDGQHISVPTSESLAPNFRAAIEAMSMA